MFFLGENLSPYKRVYYALKAYDGVGLATAKKLCYQSSIHPLCKVKDLREVHLVKLKAVLQPLLEDQKQKRLLRIKTLKTMSRPILPT